MTSERMMHCICGHAERDHLAGGGCRVPDCPCDHFQPGDTMSSLSILKRAPPYVA